MTRSIAFRSTLLGSALLLLGLAAPTGAAVFCVDSAGALQDALTAAASNGVDDEVRIVQGTYVGNFVYASAQADALSVLGGYTAGCASREVDPENSILDGNRTNTVLALSAPNVAAEFFLEGLTLRNGQRSGNGGGLFAKVGTDGVVRIEQNRIEGNLASEYGGGVFCDSSNGTASFAGNSISGNTAWIGGGVYVSGGELSFADNRISGNTVGYYGGGVYVNGEALSFADNRISGNTAAYAGGVYVSGRELRIINNSISGNTAPNGYGGGLLAHGSDFALTNNTIVDNSAISGGGLMISPWFGSPDETQVTVANNLLRNNIATDAQGADLWIDNDPDGDFLPVPLTLLNNNFDRSSPEGFRISVPITIDPSNLDRVDPLFVDAANDDLRLLPGSPMIDAGTPFGIVLSELDLEGKPRLLGSSVEIGAYEFDDGIRDRYVLALSQIGPGAGAVAIDPEGIECSGDCAYEYPANSLLSLSAEPSSGSIFAGWEGQPDCADGEILMDSGRSCMARFIDGYRLDIVLAGDGSGRVTSSPAGIDCGETCAAGFERDSYVNLIVTPDPGSNFLYDFSGDCGWGQVFMDADKSCTVTFELARNSLAVNRQGNGSVISEPAGIDCGFDCWEDYGWNTSVTLTATPDPGESFLGWSGACTGTDPTCELQMTEYREVSAAFTLTHRVTVTKTGTGGGTVSSAPEGIDCGGDCTHDFSQGTQVTLTAAPFSGQVFAGWSGACSGTGLTCTLWVEGIREVGAVFNSAGGSTCPAEATLATRTDRGPWLGLLDGVRDRVLTGTPEGRALIQTYYRHADEVTARLKAEPRLGLQALNLLLKLRAELTAAAAGEPVTLDAQKAEAIRAFARTLRRGASAELAADLEAFIALDWDGLTRPSPLHRGD
jgi:hypothetical protein